MLRKDFIVATSVLLVSTQKLASAHVRWFTSDENLQDLSFTMDALSVWILMGAAAYIALAVVIDRMGWARRIGSRLEMLQYSTQGFDWRLVSFASGAMLIANVLQDEKVFLAPNLSLPHIAFEYIYAVGQILIGVLLVFQITFSISGVLILVVTALTALLVPFNLLVDYVFEFVALGVALVFIGPSLCPLDRHLFRKLGWGQPKKFDRLPLPILRAGVGITLIILAFHNKLLNPGLAVAFLEAHSFNFMYAFGFEGFTNLHFALAAGVAEAVFGALLLAGVATRFATACLSVFFVLTLFQLPQKELIGHAPLIAIAVLLILRGSGGYRLAPPKPAGQGTINVDAAAPAT